MRKIPLVSDHENILELNKTNFKYQLKNKTVLVDFWASWCVPCRIMAPVLNEIAADLNGNTRIGKVNIEQYGSLANDYKIRNIPTMVLFKNRQEIDRFVGIKSKEYLIKQLQRVE
jgi:thioredoxin 1